RDADRRRAGVPDRELRQRARRGAAQRAVLLRRDVTSMNRTRNAMPSRVRWWSMLRMTWRSERGFGAAELLALSLVIAAAIAGYEALVKKTKSLQAAFGPLRQCQATVKAAAEGLQFNYGKHEDPDNPFSKFTGFDPNLQVP